MFFTERSNTMQICNRCKLVIATPEPREVLDGKALHLYCKWKLEQEAIRRIPDKLIDLGGDDADPLPERSGGDISIPSRGDASSASNPQGDVQSHPIPLHWTSNQ